MSDGEMVTIYTPGDRIIVLDSIGRAYVYTVEYNGVLRRISGPLAENHVCTPPDGGGRA